MRVEGTGELGLSTGRDRYRVTCLTCDVVVHEATTSATIRCRQHLGGSHGVKHRLAAHAIRLGIEGLLYGVPVYLGAENCIRESVQNAAHWVAMERRAALLQELPARDLWGFLYARARVERSRANRQARPKKQSSEAK